MEKKNVIKDNRTGKIYWDDGIIRNFETVLKTNITYPEAQKKYPDIIKI